MSWEIGDIALWTDAETAERGGAQAIVSGIKPDGHPTFVWVVPALEKVELAQRMVRISLQDSLLALRRR